MEWAAFLAFVLTSVLMDLTPGPAVLKVVGDGMRHGFKPAQASIAGILAANAMYCALSALGLSALLTAFPVLFEFIKWAGVAYLVWIGLQSLRHAWTGEAVRATVSPRGTPRALFRSSFVLQGANPKSYLYFAAILPAFAPADAAVDPHPRRHLDPARISLAARLFAARRQGGAGRHRAGGAAQLQRAVRRRRHRRRRHGGAQFPGAAGRLTWRKRETFSTPECL